MRRRPPFSDSSTRRKGCREQDVESVILKTSSRTGESSQSEIQSAGTSCNAESTSSSQLASRQFSQDFQCSNHSPYAFAYMASELFAAARRSSCPGYMYRYATSRARLALSRFTAIFPCSLMMTTPWLHSISTLSIFVSRVHWIDLVRGVRTVAMARVSPLQYPNIEFRTAMAQFR
jgi:hypothetical protein